MNSLTALILWLLSQLVPGDGACAMLDIPVEHCSEQRVQAGMLPEGDSNRSSEGSDAQNSERPRVRADFQRSRATRISNGF